MDFGFAFSHHLISNLVPFTQYAYFVRTMTIINYHRPSESYSPIQYFKTLPSRPGKVSKIVYQHFSKSQMVVNVNSFNMLYTIINLTDFISGCLLVASKK